MIYIENNTNSIEIPKHYSGHITPAGGSYLLKLHNVSTNSDHVISIGRYKDQYDLIYKFENLNFSGLVTGEYEYSLTDTTGLDVFESGILQVGNYKNNNKQYGKTGYESPVTRINGKAYEG
jgi:hypothetical protein